MSKRRLHFPDTTNLSLILTGLMFMLPAINMYHRVPVTSFYTEWIAGALGLAALAPLLRTPVFSCIRIPQVSLLFPALAAILGVQWASGMLHSNQYALLVLSYLGWAFMLTLLGNHLRRHLGWEKLVNTLALFLVSAGIVNGGMMVLQIVTRTGGTIAFLPDLSSYGPFGQENHFADFITLATASLIYLYAKGRLSAAFFSLILTWFLLMLAVSGSRSSWLYLSIIASFALVMQLKAITQHRSSAATRSLLYMSLVAIPAFALVHVLAYYVAPEGLFRLTTDRIVNGINIDTPSARMQIWYDSFRLFWQSPWLGIGVGNINSESFLLLDRTTALSANRIFEHAHNLFLHLLTEMGIGAFLVALAGLTMWFRRFQWRELTPETWWLISLVAILGIHSMLEYPLWYAYFLGVAAILLGAGDERTITIDVAAKPGKLMAKSARGGLALVLALGTLNLGTMLAAHIKLEHALYQPLQTDAAKQKQDIDWVYRYTLLSPYAELMYAVSIVMDRREIDSQIALNNTAIDFRPFSKICYQQVALLKLKGDDLNARKLLKRTLMVYPAHVYLMAEAMPEHYRNSLLQTVAEVDPVLYEKITAQAPNHSKPDAKQR